MDINLLTAEEKKQLFEELGREVEPSKPSAPPLKHVKCSCGFEWDLDPDVLDDVELIDDLMAMDDQRPNVTPVLQRILGKEGQQALYEACRTGGKVRLSLVWVATQEIFDQLKEKNF